jgi:hypothetical protein
VGGILIAAGVLATDTSARTAGRAAGDPPPLEQRENWQFSMAFSGGWASMSLRYESVRILKYAGAPLPAVAAFQTFGRGRISTFIDLPTTSVSKSRASEPHYVVGVLSTSAAMATASAAGSTGLLRYV